MSPCSDPGSPGPVTPSETGRLTWGRSWHVLLRGFQKKKKNRGICDFSWSLIAWKLGGSDRCSLCDDRGRGNRVHGQSLLIFENRDFPPAVPLLNLWVPIGSPCNRLQVFLQDI